ncbi:hypothetical protein V5O48_004721 [Marasmius crinis-equi]|uniref:SH3 domain-containing protein n=1 Tax=Marasmius crinis-equi TaxID=585013 RepID=A0ABR3FP89_9AGAR
MEKRGSLLAFTPTTAFTDTSTIQDPEAARRSIQIRDYAFQISLSDPRSLGLGEDVPKPNRVRLLNRRLLGEEGWKVWRKKRREERKRARDSIGSTGSTSSWASEDDWEDEGMDPDTDDEDDVSGWGSMDDISGDPPDNGDELYTEGQEDLQPGLYRALYAFDPEGADEMALQEDQVVRVVGRGGDGWAVVIAENQEESKLKHALVPESYLEVVKLDSDA